MEFLILFLLVVAAALLVLIRMIKRTVAWLRDPEKVSQLWRENRRSIVGSAAIMLILLGGLGLFVVSYLVGNFRVGREAFNYLHSKYGIQTGIEMSFTGETGANVKTNGVNTKTYRIEYTVGTNSGLLTMERVKGPEGTRYVFVSDEPKH